MYVYQQIDVSHFQIALYGQVIHGRVARAIASARPYLTLLV